jgi:hypothetical protein
MRRSWFIFKGARHWVWRDAKGRIVKWGFKPPFVEPLFMYRYTYAVNYGWSNKYYSYRLQKWSVDSQELARERSGLKKEMEQSFEKYRRCSFQDLEAHGDRIKTVGDTIEKVAFDPKLIGRVEIIDEKHA